MSVGKKGSFIDVYNELLAVWLMYWVGICSDGAH